MKSEEKNIELPFDLVALSSDLNEISKNLEEAVAMTPDCPEEIDLLMGVVDCLQEMIKEVKDPEMMDRKSKISLIAHFTLLQDLVSMMEPDEDFDEDDFDEEELEEKE